MKNASDHVMWLSPRRTLGFAGWSDGRGVEAWSEGPDGLVAVGGEPVVVGSGQSLHDLVGDHSRSLVSQAADLEGLYGLVRLDRRGRAEIINDPFGVHLIYTAETSTTRIFSNKADLVAAVIEAEKGRTVEADVDALATVVALGHMVGTTTGYRGVTTLPFGCGVSIDESCKVEIKKSRPDPWAVEIDPGGPTSAEIEQLEARMVAFTRAVLAANPTKTIAELTAGRDSRLVLAVLERAGILDDITFFTRGPEQSRDFEGASTIADRLGLKFATASWDIPVEGYTAFYEAHIERVSGQLGCWESTAPRQPDHFTLSGLFGETLRAVYEDVSGVSKVDELVSGFVARQESRAGPLRPEVLTRTLEMVIELMLEPLEEGYLPEDLGDIFFAKHRMRRLFGAQMERHTGYFYPLYMGGLSRTAFEWGANARSEDRLRLALMDRSSLGLDDLEFGKTSKKVVPVSERPSSLGRYPVASFSETAEQRSKRLSIAGPSRQEAVAEILAAATDSEAFEVLDGDAIQAMSNDYAQLTTMDRIRLHWALTPVLFMRSR